MIGGQVKIHGIAQSIKQLQKMEPRLAKNVLRGAVRNVAAEIRNDAKGRVPSDTGKLRKNIVVRGHRSRRYAVASVVRVRTLPSAAGGVTTKANVGGKSVTLKRSGKNNAFYWFFVEYGTRFMPPRPYLRPAYENMRVHAINVMARYMRGRIDKALRPPGGVKKPSR